MTDGDIVNVIDFGADPTGASDSSAAIQAAVNSITSGVIFFPTGTYKVLSTINVDSSAKPYINFTGTGSGSKLLWDLSSDGPIINFKKGSNSAYITIENLRIENNYRTGDTTLNNVVGIRIGEKDAAATTGNNGTCNVSINKCQFLYCDTPIEIYSESDQISVTDCYFFVWTGYAILGTKNPLVVTGTGNAAVRVLNNLFMGGQTGSWAIRINGSACYVIGNVIQNATQGQGIWLASGAGFNISTNYTESTGNGKFIYCEDSDSGYIGENEIGGYPGASIIHITANTDNVNIGANYYAVSGGFPTNHILIDSGATGVNILGKQQATSGSSNLISGSPNLFVDGAGKLQSSIVNSSNGSVNVATASSETIFTSASKQTYLVTVTQGAENYAETAIVTVPEGATTAVVTSLYQTNANLAVSASGLDIQVDNGVGSTRTVTFSYLRIS
jgi:hypothetical protein